MPESVAVCFDDRDEADAFGTVLGEEGLRWRLHREEFAGEDDAEDAAWVVEVDEAPAGIVQRAEAAGGWLIPSGGEPAPSAPLPQGPRRLKRCSAPREG